MKTIHKKIVLFGHILSSSKDARLPVQLQRAMAAEAEAAREARAKVRMFCSFAISLGCKRHFIMSI